MAKTQILDYYIHLTDKAKVDTYNDQLVNPASLATASPGGVGSPCIQIPHTGKFAILRAPEAAAVEFSAPLQDEGTTFAAPCTRSPWFVPGANNFPRNVATFTRKSGGWFGIPSLFGTTTKFYWAGHFVFAQPGTGNPVDGNNAPVTAPADIPQRIAIGGFESGDHAAEGQVNATANAANTSTPRAARHVGDIGYGYRSETTGTDYAEYFEPSSGPFDVVKTGRERFYLRIERFGASETAFWKARQAAQTGEGFAVAITPSGQLAFYFMTSDTAGDRELLGTAGALVAGQNYKIDIVWGFLGDTGPPVVKRGCFALYLDGAKIGEFSHVLNGIQTNIRWNSSRLGKHYTSSGDFELNFDSWILSVAPADKDPLLGHWSSQSVAYVVGDVRHYDGDPASLGTGGLKVPSSVNAYKCIANHTSNSSTNIPTNTALWVKLGPSLDWLVGSRVVRIRPNGDGPARSGWTGAWQIARQNPPNLGTFADGLTATASGAIMEVTCDVSDVGKIFGQRGVVAIATSYFGNRSSGVATDGSVNASVNGALQSEVPVLQTASEAFNGGLAYNPAGLQAGVALSSLNVRYTTGTITSGTATLRGLAAVAEVIGIFGKEDIPPGTVDVPAFPNFHAFQHNRWVWRSPWALAASRGIAPMVIHTGTYVGNGVETILNFRVPPHMLFIRRVTGTGDDGLRWLAGMMGGGHIGVEAGFRPQAVSLVEVDPTFVPAGGEDDQAQRYRARICGSHAQFNQNAVTYAYIAVCDPGARFLLTGSFRDESGGTTPQNHLLVESNFTPEAGWFFVELASAASTGQHAFKGVGLGTDEAVEFPGTQRTSYAKFNAGSFDYHKGASGMLDAQYLNVGYGLFRRNDGNGSAEKAFALLSWVGDGAASRTINTGFITGLRPVWAWVSGSGGSSFFRDPQHTSTNSTNVSSGTQGTTGITGGAPDAISVGSLLNANGVTYTAIVFMGSATAGNNGWSIDGEFVPIEPDYIKDPNWTEPTEIVITFVPTGPTGPLVSTPDLDTGTTPGTTDLGGTGPLGSSSVNTGGLVGGQPCEVYTRALLNMALQRIGQSKVIGNAATDNTEEAAMARGFVLEDVNQVLRDFPWPFATRYSTLVLVGGTTTVPVNNDWQYSYRAPSGMMFPRRIAKAGNARTFDPNPIPFREVSDSTGHLIFCNEPTSASVPLVLEYTARITCPAFYGDAMFRDALCWRFAASFAMALAKDSDKQKFCLAQYQAVLNFAQVDAANAQQTQPAELAEGDADWISDRN